MKNRILISGAVAALSMGVFVAPASADGKNPPDSCGAGSAVSFAPKFTKANGTNFGQANKELLGITPGEAIQDYRDFFKANCEGN